ncbi:MAG: hypothetical protein J7K98_00830 [Candidatus Aenigmarchaeota archaeon]|nr:hypothetical protein [Candidatus Aenigmarchaeota archaeon]
MKNKGMSGKVIATVITLILALVALILLWRIYKFQVFGTLLDVLSRAVENFAGALYERVK